MELATARLVLRDFVEDDWRPLNAMESIPDVVRFQMNDVHDEQRSREYVQGVMVHARELPRMVYDLAITLDGTYIGRTGMRRSDADPRLGEVWFVLSPDQRDRGYATEAVRALISYAFGELGLHRVFGDCDPRNTASARVMERLGMRREGHLVQNIWVKGEWCDSWIYAVLAHEWSRA